jgi:hypothetical protein
MGPEELTFPRFGSAISKISRFRTYLFSQPAVEASTIAGKPRQLVPSGTHQLYVARAR